MVDVDTSVKNIAAGTLTRRAIVDIGVVARLIVRDASESPRRTAVRKPVPGVGLGILLDPLDLAMSEYYA